MLSHNVIVILNVFIVYNKSTFLLKKKEKDYMCTAVRGVLCST